MRLGFGKIFSSDHLCGHPPIIKYLCSASHTRITSLAATTTLLSISEAPPIPKVNNWVEGSVFSCYLPPRICEFLPGRYRCDSWFKLSALGH
jgi:hypothetical protein